MNRHIKFHGKVRRYNHNLSYRNFFSGEIGELRPVWLEDGVPGDTFQYKPELRLYFSPLVFPVLSSMKARVDVFFCPNRLAWFDWENFLTGGPEDNLSPAYPSIRNIAASLTSAATFSSFITANIESYHSLLNNLGHPYSDPTSSYILSNDPYDMIPTYDYCRIWDDYYRDEEKETPITYNSSYVAGDVYDLFDTNMSKVLSFLGGGQSASPAIPCISWSKDYFTTASLQQQRGGDIPLFSPLNLQFVDHTKTFGSTSSPLYVGGTLSSFGEGNVSALDSNNTTLPLESSLSINGLRYLYSAANWLNNNVIGGTRYIEQLRTRYKVVSSDARLQRPEMIGSISVPVNIDVVTQTSSTVDDGTDILALGERAGKASVIGSGKTITYSCEEFGYFIGILHVAPKPAYFQGIRFNLQREDKFDFWQPEFERVPQRPIRNNEIYAVGSSYSPETGGIFGYTGQYNEYRHHNDEVHGDFQDTLLAFTTARKFSSLPSLASSAFLHVDHDTQGNNRIFADPSSEFGHIQGVVNNIVLAKREISNREPHF